MRVLIIGGTGFIGVHVLHQLLEEGHDVALFQRGQTRTELSFPVHHIYGDRKELPTFASDFRGFAPDVVLDMIPFTEQDALSLMSTFRGTARRVVAISSMDVYRAYGLFRRSEVGKPEPMPFDEDAPLRSSLFPYRSLAQSAGDILYNYEKILVERIVLNDDELSGTVLRLPCVYGAGDSYHRTFEYLKRMDDGRPAIILSEAKAQWRWTRGYMENVAAAITLAMTHEESADRIYNVGEAEALTEAEWVGEIGRAAGWNGDVITESADMLPKHLVEEYDYRHNLAANTGRIRRELGYSEPVSREAALKRTVAWERRAAPKEVSAERFDYAAEDEALTKIGRLRR